MLKKSSKRFVSIALAIAMILTMVPFSALADETTASDLDGHWAENVITEWMNYGVIKGYEDGTIRPNNSITRAEMTAMLDRVMDYQTKAANNFSDLQDTWYTDVILKANAAGVIGGYPDGTVKPDATITRQEAVAMFSRVLSLDTESAPEASFTDNADVADWAKDAVNAMAAKGYIHGSDGQFRPNDGITRAEVITIFNNIFAELYQAAGEYTGDVDGSAVVSADDVTLKDMTITGDLIIAEGVGDGHVVLDNVTVDGQLIVRGGGENSVIIKGSSKIGTVSVERIDGGVRVAVEGNAAVTTVTVVKGDNAVKIEGTVKNINVKNADCQVDIDGTVEAVNVLGNNVTVNVAKGADVNAVTTSAENTTVNVAGTVQTITTDAAGTTVEGSGSVSSVEVGENASNTTVTTEDTKVENNSSSDVSIGDGEVIAPGDTNTTPGGTTETPSVPSTPSTPSVTYYTVTFMNGDQAISTQSIASGSTATEPTEGTEGMPSVEPGNKLTWYNDSSEPFDFATPITGNITLTAVVGSDDFAAGNGTEAYPYLISNAAQFKAIDNIASAEKIYYQLTNSFTVTREDAYTDGAFYAVLQKLSNCVLDGNGNTITVDDPVGMLNLIYTVNEATIEKLKVVLDYSLSVKCSATTFNDVDVLGAFEVTGNEGAYVIYATPLTPGENHSTNNLTTYSTTINFENCNANVQMIGSGDSTNYNAVFVGYAMYYKLTDGLHHCYEYLNFTNCTNEGSLICGKASMFLGNVPSEYAHPTITVNKCSNNGLIQATSVLESDPDKYADKSMYSHFVSSNARFATVVKDGTAEQTGDALAAASLPMDCGEKGSFVHGPDDSSLKLTKNSDGTFTITPASTSGVAYYEVEVGLYTTLIEGGTNRFYAKERINVNDNPSLTTTLKYLSFVDEKWVTANSSSAQADTLAGNTIYSLDGTSYYYIGDESTGSTLNGTSKAPQMVSVSAYDANGKLLASAALSN